MGQRNGVLPGLAILAAVIALLHVVYAASGGITSTRAVAWLLALGTVMAAGLAWKAQRDGPWWLAWPALGLLVLPLAVTWPAAAVSLPGLVVVLLVAVVGVGLIIETARRLPPV